MPSRTKNRQKASDALRRLSGGVTKVIRPSTRSNIESFSDINRKLADFERGRRVDMDFSNEQLRINKAFNEKMKAVDDKQIKLEEERRVIMVERRDAMKALSDKFKTSEQYSSFNIIQRGFEDIDDELPLSMM